MMRLIESYVRFYHDIVSRTTAIRSSLPIARDARVDQSRVDLR